MKRPLIQQYQMLARVADFGAKHVGMFPKATIAGEILAEIETTVTRLSAQATSQVSGNASVRTSSKLRRAARAQLKSLLGSVEQTARALKIDNFWAPKQANENELIASGRAFAEAAEPLKNEFIQHGLPQDFIDRLNTAVRTLEGSILSRAAGTATRSGAIKEFEKTLIDSLNLVDRFEALVVNTMADNPAVMAAWNVARKIDRIGRAKAASPTEDANLTPPAAAPQPIPTVEPAPASPA